MGNSSCTLVLRADGNLCYSSGDTVVGRIYLSVNDPNGVSCQSLNIHFCGKESAVVHYTTDETVEQGNAHGNNHRHTESRDHYESNQIDVLNFDVPIHTPLQGRFAPGQYEFPFQFTIPPNIPSSMMCRNGESHCSVQYQIKAYFRRQSNSSFTLNPLRRFNNTTSSETQNVTIFGHDASVTSHHQEDTLHFPSESYDINACCCRRMGHMQLAATLNSFGLQVVPCNPRSYTVTFTLRNESKIDVQKVQMELIEQIAWRPRSREHNERETMVTQVLDGKTMASWRPLNVRATSLSGSGDSPYTPLGAASNEDTAIFTFTVPNIARNSFNGTLIRVTHFMRLQVKTDKCCTTNPEISADVNICRPDLLNQRYDGSDIDGLNSNNLPLPSAPVMDHNSSEESNIVDAAVLPSDWSPHTADLVTLPVATVVGVSSIQDTNDVQFISSSQAEASIPNAEVELFNEEGEKGENSPGASAPPYSDK